MWAIVTGASSGIGRDMSRYLFDLGYNLVIIARDKDKLDKLKKELLEKVEKKNEKREILVIQSDLSIKDNCFDIYRKTKDLDIDLLINNAGFGVFGNFVETDLEKEINLINTNITAVHILTKLYLKDMVEKNKGRILNVASIAGMEPGPLMATYYASKSYVIRLSRAINKELKKKKSKVKISILCPGPVDTNFNNVANVKFKAPSEPSEKVAKYGIDKTLKGKLIIIPGILNKSVRIFSKIIPDCILESVAYHIQIRKRK
jgi:short-subunit dehydrogenase